MRGKFQRNYKLDIFTPAGVQITVQPPFSIAFNISRNTLSSANKGDITIYNLGQATRNQIYKDRFSITEYWRSLYLPDTGTGCMKFFPVIFMKHIHIKNVQNG